MVIPSNYSVFVKPSESELSQRKLEQLEHFAEVRNYWLRNPIVFMDDILGINLFDAQAWAISNIWYRPYGLWLFSRGGGKSTLIDAICMSKMFLIPNFASHIASGTGEQSISTFNTLIRLAQKSITSMPGLTDVWSDQLVVKDARGDGFVRNPAGFSCELYNGSTCRALNGNFNARRGQRSNMVVFDEVGWLTEELMAVY